MVKRLNPGEIYEHYTGSRIKILSFARDKDNPDIETILYEQLDDTENAKKGERRTTNLNNILGEIELKEDFVLNGRKYKKGERIEEYHPVDQDNKN